MVSMSFGTVLTPSHGAQPNTYACDDVAAFVHVPSTLCNNSATETRSEQLKLPSDIRMSGAKQVAFDCSVG